MPSTVGALAFSTTVTWLPLAMSPRLQLSVISPLESVVVEQAAPFPLTAAELMATPPFSGSVNVAEVAACGPEFLIWKV